MKNAIRVSSLPTIVCKGPSHDYYWSLLGQTSGLVELPQTFAMSRGSQAEEDLIRFFEEKNLTRIYGRQDVVTKSLDGIEFIGHIDGKFAPYVSSEPVDNLSQMTPLEIKTMNFRMNLEAMKEEWAVQAGCYAWAMGTKNAVIFAATVFDIPSDAMVKVYKNSSQQYLGLDSRFEYLKSMEEGIFYQHNSSVMIFDIKNIYEQTVPALTTEYMMNVVVPKVREFLSLQDKIFDKEQVADLQLEMAALLNAMDESEYSAKCKESHSLKKLVEDVETKITSSGLSVAAHKKIVGNLLLQSNQIPFEYKDVVGFINYKPRLKLIDSTLDSDPTVEGWVAQGLESGKLEKLEATRTIKWKK